MKEHHWLINFNNIVDKNLQSEWGSTNPIRVADSKLLDSNNQEVEINCKCGTKAAAIFIGKEALMGICSNCQYGE